MQKNDDHHQSRFLEAPFVRMLRMRSASLKIQAAAYNGARTVIRHNQQNQTQWHKVN